MLRPLFVLAVVAVATPVVHGQFGGDERPGMESYSAYLLQVGGENLPSDVIRIVAEQLRPRLPDYGRAPAAEVKMEFTGNQLGRASLIGLTVWIPEAANVSTEAQKRELWNVARLQLERELQRVAELAYTTQRVRVQRELDEKQNEHKKLEAQAAQLTEQVATLEAATAGMDRDALAKAIAEAVSNQRGLQLEAAGIQARREAIEKRIDELRERAAQAGDPIATELQRMVEAREAAQRALEQLVQVGKVTQLELMEGNARLAEAKIEHLKAQREAEDRIGGGALRELNNELSKLLVEAAKVSGQQKQLEQIVAELREQVISTARASAALAPLRAEHAFIGQRQLQLHNETADLQRNLSELSGHEISLQPLVDDKAAAAGGAEASAPEDSQAEESAPDQP